MTIHLGAPDVVGTRVRSSRVGWVGQIGTVKAVLDDLLEIEWDVLLKLGSPAPCTAEHPDDLHPLEVRS